jgi:L-fuconolactonase
MRIDTHQHFWNYSKEQYPWIGEGMDALAKDRLPADLKPLLEEHEIQGTVAVQARQVVEETESLLAMADEYDFIRGVVGWVDLCSPDVEAQLEQFAANPKLVGVRHVVQEEPDDWFVLREDFQRGIAKLNDYGLVYDLLIFPKQLEASIEFVRRFPDQAFILDHIAKPDIKNQRIGLWDDGIRRLAAFDNVSCKLSGMVTEANWNDWKPADFQPYMEVVLEAFGANRLTIGSDWPVCTLAGEYDDVVKIASKFVARLSASEQEAIWEKNPARIYGL